MKSPDRDAAARGGEITKAKMTRRDPDYYKQIGRLGGLAKARRAAGDPDYAPKRKSKTETRDD